MLRRIYRTVAAYLRKPVRRAIVIRIGNRIVMNPVHYDSFKRRVLDAPLARGALRQLAVEIVPDICCPAYSMRTRREAAREAWHGQA